MALVVFVGLAVVHTWPLATNPARLSRNDNADTLLNTWAIAWVAHQLPRHPTRLFDANIFYPERRTLAYSESMPVQGVLAMPVLAADGSPVLAFNLVLMAGFALTGWAFWLLAHRWTGSVSAAYVSGSLAGFNAHVLVRLPHLQTQHVEFIAAVLFALDALFTSRRFRYAFLLGAAFALQALTSVYIFVFTIWMVLFAAAARAHEWLRQDRRRSAALAGTAALVAAVILAPYIAAYVEVHRAQGFERTVDDSRRWAGSWMDYLSTGARLYFPLFGERFFYRTVTCSFPGFTAAALVLVAIVWPETRRDRRVRMCLAAALGCAGVAFAPHAPFFPLFYRFVPLFRIVRVNAHIGQIVLLMVAVVAPFGMAGLLRRCAPRLQGPMALIVLVLVNGEALRAPLAYEPFAGIPHVYDRLALERGAVVVEFPFYEPSIFFGNAPYMLASTRHWQPLLNGYSGFRPGSYDETFKEVSGFPDAASLVALKERGVTHVVVHRDGLAADRVEAIARIASLEPFADDDGIAIYRLR